MRGEIILDITSAGARASIANPNINSTLLYPATVSPTKTASVSLKNIKIYLDFKRSKTLNLFQMIDIVHFEI